MAQVVSPGVPAYVPAAQAMARPLGQWLPRGQAMQLVAAVAVADDVFPASQLMGADDWATQYEPAGQGLETPPEQ